MNEFDDNYKKQISILDKYTINPNLLVGNIFHIYPKDIAFPDGFHDSRFFDLWLFNSETMEKRLIENRDGITYDSGVQIYMTRVYIDGSFFIRFMDMIELDIYQCIQVRKSHLKVEKKGDY